MKTIFLIKRITSRPSDAIDTTNLWIFSFFQDRELVCRAEVEDGVALPVAIKKLVLQHAGKVSRMIEKIRLMRAIQPDYLMGLGGIEDLPFLLAKPRGTKYLVTYHSCLFKKSDQYWKVRMPWFLRKFMLGKTDIIFAPSDWARSTIVKYFPEKVVYGIHSGVDLGLFKSAPTPADFLRETFSITNDKPNVLYVGTLQPRKRPDIFIEIAGAYGGGANFILVGHSASDIDYLSSTGNMPNFFHREGMSRVEIAKLFNAVDLFVFPSVQEPFGLVVVEAMACGLPVILSRSGAFPELVREGEDGFLIAVTEREVGDFVSAIRTVLDDAALRARLSKNAAARACLFDWKQTAMRYRDILVLDKKI